MSTTRYYLARDAGAPVAPAYAAPWTWTAGAIRRALLTDPLTPAETLASSLVTDNQSGATRALHTQHVGPPLPGGVVITSCRVVSGARQSFGGFDFYFRAIVRVVSGDGLTVRGTLLDATNPNEVATSAGLPTRTVAGTAPAITVEAGDRIVLEMGLQTAVSSSGDQAGSVWRGTTDAGADAPFADGVSVAGVVPRLRSWVEITYEDPPAPDPVLGLHFVGATQTTITVAWSPPSTGPAPTGYLVQFQPDEPTYVDVGSSLTRTIAGLEPDTVHQVNVCAYNDVGQSTPETLFDLATLPLLVDPPAPDPRWWTHRLAGQLGLDAVDEQPVVELRRWSGAAWEVDETLSRALTGYRIAYGRKDAAGRTPPTSCRLQLITARAGSIPITTRLQLGFSPAVCAALGITAADGVRWTGEVTDPSVDHAGRVTTLTCVGRLGRTSRVSVDPTGWAPNYAPNLLPIILSAAATGSGIDVLESAGGLLQLPAAPTAVATLLDGLVASTGEQLVEQPAGHLDWHGPDHRRQMAPRLTLTAAAVLRRVTWSQSVADLVNVVDVAYAGEQRVTVEDTASSDPVVGYGRWPAGVDTYLVDESDAYDLGMLVVGRRAAPAWRLPDLTVIPDRMLAAGRLSVPDVAALLTMRHGHRIELQGLPTACPVPDRVIVEGWEETATPRAWQLSLSVSDPAVSGVSLRWVDIDPAVAWEDIDPAVRWLDIARMESSAELLSPPD